jgi:hypothetical protein
MLKVCLNSSFGAHRKKAWVLLCCCLFPCLLAAQGVKPVFNSITQAGLLLGAAQTALTAQTINGIRFQRITAGLGIGYDEYGFKSLPAFADIRYTLSKKTKRLEVYADAGLNVPLHSSALPKRRPDGTLWHILQPSFYGEAGISCKVIRWGENGGITISAGYSYKTFHYAETRHVSYGSIHTDRIAYRYQYRRYALRLGVAL